MLECATPLTTCPPVVLCFAVSKRASWRDHSCSAQQCACVCDSRACVLCVCERVCVCLPTCHRSRALSSFDVPRSNALVLPPAVKNASLGPAQCVHLSRTSRQLSKRRLNRHSCNLSSLPRSLSCFVGGERIGGCRPQADVSVGSASCKQLARGLRSHRRQRVCVTLVPAVL